MWVSKPSPGLGRLRVVGLASHPPLRTLGEGGGVKSDSIIHCPWPKNWNSAMLTSARSMNGRRLCPHHYVTLIRPLNDICCASIMQYISLSFVYYIIVLWWNMTCHIDLVLQMLFCMFYKSCPSYVFPLEFWIWIQASVDPNELRCHFYVVLHALWSGIVFALFFYFLHGLSSSFLFSLWFTWDVYLLIAFNWWVVVVISRGPASYHLTLV